MEKADWATGWALKYTDPMVILWQIGKQRMDLAAKTLNLRYISLNHIKLMVSRGFKGLPRPAKNSSWPFV